MAVKKATTTADIKAEEPKAGTPGLVKVKAPSGHVTEVPEGIVEALLASGYKRTR